MIALPRQPEGHECGAKSIENTGRNFEWQSYKGQSVKSCGQGVQLQHTVVGIAVSEQVLRSPNRPVEVARSQLKMAEKGPATEANGQADSYGDEDAQSHRNNPHKVVT
jgi:hypothetical protein